MFGKVRCSDDFPWFERQSIKLTGVDYVRDQSADSLTIKDNQAGKGTTPLTAIF